MRQLSRLLLVSTLALGLAGCNTIEHRSEIIPKAPLPPLSNQKMHTKAMWSSKHGVGSAKKEANLHLAITPTLVISMDTKGELRAQDRQTGKMVWKIYTKVEPASGPTVIQNMILIGSTDAYLQAYRLQDGALAWRVPVSGEMLSTPKGVQNTVYFSTLDGSVIALNVEDGRQLWRYSLNSPSIVLRHSSSPALTSQHVIAGFANGRLVALNRRDGSVEWEREVSIPKGRSDIQRMSDIAADPVIMNEVVYVVNYQGRLAALSVQSGNPIWERDMSSYTGFNVGRQAIFVSDIRGHVWSVDRRSGKTLWEQPALQGRYLTKPVLWNDLLVVADDEGYLHWLSQSTGYYIDRIKLDGKGIETPPVLIDNKLYVLSKSGKIIVYCLNEPVGSYLPEQTQIIKPLLKQKTMQNQTATPDSASSDAFAGV